MKMQAFRPSTLLKRYSNTGAFSVNIANFFRTPNLKNICERLLLSQRRLTCNEFKMSGI